MVEYMLSTLEPLGLIPVLHHLARKDFPGKLATEPRPNHSSTTAKQCPFHNSTIPSSLNKKLDQCSCSCQGVHKILY